jgi:hypothetical protein
MSYFVYDYCNSFGYTDDKDEAKQMASITHAQNTDQYHEVHKKGLSGIKQLEPDDCWKCGRNIHRCECKGLGYMLSVCLGNCEVVTELKRQCSNTNCALNPWFPKMFRDEQK